MESLPLLLELLTAIGYVRMLLEKILALISATMTAPAGQVHYLAYTSRVGAADAELLEQGALEITFDSAHQLGVNGEWYNVGESLIRDCIDKSQ
jgi:hypothetical protein